MEDPGEERWLPVEPLRDAEFAAADAQPPRHRLQWLLPWRFHRARAGAIEDEITELVLVWLGSVRFYLDSQRVVANWQLR